VARTPDVQFPCGTVKALHPDFASRNRHLKNPPVG
jgi:hypothetical protein